MKYIRNFDSFKRKEKVNEEFLGNIMNFFKNLWNKAVQEFKKLGENPSIEDIDKYLETKIFNPSDANYIFKSVIEEFAKKPDANNEDCLNLVSNILNPESGALGKQGLQPLYDGLLKVYGKNLAPIEIVKFIIETARNRAIKDYKFAGGPDFKAGQEAKISPESIKTDINDTTHLPDYKKVLKAVGEDNKKRKEAALNWVKKTLTPRILKYIQEIKPEQVEEYLESKNIEVPTGASFEVGDTVIYKREKFEEAKWKELKDEDKAKPNEGKVKELVDAEMIAIKKVSKIEGTKISFEGADFTKEKGDILMKVEEEKAGGQDELVKTLGDLKTKNPESIQKMDRIAKLYQEPDKNKEKIANIQKELQGQGQK